MQFTKPDEQTIARMTPKSLEVLIDTLKKQRAAAVAPHDRQIKFYEDLLEKKRGNDAKAAS